MSVDGENNVAFVEESIGWCVPLGAIYCDCEARFDGGPNTGRSELKLWVLLVGVNRLRCGMELCGSQQAGYEQQKYVFHGREQPGYEVGTFPYRVIVVSISSR